MLSVPDGVDVRKVDLSIELQILAYHEQRKEQRRAAVQGGVEGGVERLDPDARDRTGSEAVGA